MKPIVRLARNHIITRTIRKLHSWFFCFEFSSSFRTRKIRNKKDHSCNYSRIALVIMWLHILIVSGARLLKSDWFRGVRLIVNCTITNFCTLRRGDTFAPHLISFSTMAFLDILPRGGGGTRFARWRVCPSQSLTIDPLRDWN